LACFHELAIEIVRKEKLKHTNSNPHHVTLIKEQKELSAQQEA